MSNMSNIHNLVVYDPKNPTKPFDGQRISKHSFKTDKVSGVKKDSKAVSIPKLSKDVIHEIGLQDHIIGYLESVQDAIIKNLVIEGKTQVADEQINVAAMIQYLEAESSGARLTKEAVEQWYQDKVADNLAMVLMQKLGVSETLSSNEEKQINAILAEFKGKISGLAGGKTSYAPKIAEQVKKAVELCEDEEDALKVKFIARLDKMISANAEVDLLSAL